MNHKLGRLESVVLNVPPGLVADGGVGLPMERADISELTALQIEYARMLVHGIVLVVDHSDVISVLERTVVVESRKAGEIRTDRGLPDPPVEVHDVGVIFLDQLRAPRQPIICPRL